MQLKKFSALLAAALLVLASLACNAITGGPLNSAQSTANAVLTSAASGDFEATAESAKATADAALNNLGEATETVEPGPVGEEATETPEAEPTDSGGFGGDAPSDVPIIEAQNNILFTSPEIVSYETEADYATTVQFYKDEMPNNGWEIDTSLSIETDSATILQFAKDNRQASVSVTVDTNTNATIVLITISSN